MNAPVTDCQCTRWPQERCEARMTQEDLLCDNCRDGCSLVSFGPDWSTHVKVTDFKFTLDHRA